MLRLVAPDASIEIRVRFSLSLICLLAIRFRFDRFRDLCFQQRLKNRPNHVFVQIPWSFKFLLVYFVFVIFEIVGVICLVAAIFYLPIRPIIFYIVRLAGSEVLGRAERENCL